MDAGRELDALIALQVFRYTLDYEFAETFGAPTALELVDHYDEWGLLPDYSTDMSAAFEIVEHFRRQWAAGDATSSFWTFKDCGNQPWQAQIEFFSDHDAPVVEFQGEADTLPLAICRAALSTLGVPS